MPLFLSRDLGVKDASQLAFWTGLALGGTGLAMTLAGPIWGAVGDRFGLKSMVVRALFGGGLAVLLMGLVTTPIQLVGTRVLFGALAGAVTAANALVVAETPRERVTRALGVMGSGLPLGRSFGPLVGSLLILYFSFRSVFIATGVFIAAATVLVLLAVRETPRSRAGERRGFAELRRVDRATLRALVAIIVAQGFVQWCSSSAQGLLAVRALLLDPRGAAFASGLAFGIGGLATAASSYLYWRPATRMGLGRFAIFGSVLLFGAVAVLAFAPSVAAIVAANGIVGLVTGALSPTLAAMLGLEAPAGAKGTVFGWAGSAASIGIGAGPFLAGVVAAASNVSIGLVVSGAAGLLAALTLLVWGREPSLQLRKTEGAV
jgi:DHA1 family multidrug resistance protein-like MFS transporter